MFIQQGLTFSCAQGSNSFKSLLSLCAKAHKWSVIRSCWCSWHWVNFSHHNVDLVDRCKACPPHCGCACVAEGSTVRSPDVDGAAQVSLQRASCKRSCLQGLIPPAGEDGAFGWVGVLTQGTLYFLNSVRSLQILWTWGHWENACDI